MSEDLPLVDESARRSPTVVVWMVNYNSADFVAECLASLADSNIGRVAVLDNGSNLEDRDRLFALQEHDSRVVVYLSEENLGFGGGVNRLASLERSGDEEYIWILNPDTHLVKGETSALTDLLASSSYDIVSPVISTGPSNDMKVWFAGGTYDTAKGICAHTGFGASLASVAEDHFHTDFMTGAAPFMRRRTWELLGGFDESLFLYWEDVDLSLRAKTLGLKLGVCSSVVVWHYEGGSGGTGSGHSKIYYYYMNRNRVVVCAPHSSLKSVLLADGRRETLRLLAQPLLVPQRGRLSKFASALRGLADGFLSFRSRP